MVGFSGILRYWLGRRSLDDKRQIARWKGIVSGFKGKLIKMIVDGNGRFDDYCLSPKIRQLLLYWDYELVESDLLFCSYKKELLLAEWARIIAKENINIIRVVVRENLLNIILKIGRDLTEKARNKHKDFSEEGKESKIKYGSNIDIAIWKKMQANRMLKKWSINLSHSIKMSKKKLKFHNSEINKKKFTLLLATNYFRFSAYK